MGKWIKRNDFLLKSPYRYYVDRDGILRLAYVSINPFIKETFDIVYGVWRKFEENKHHLR